MRFQINPVPQKLAPKFHEVSSLRSPRDGDVVPKIHYKTKDTTNQTSQLVQNVQQLQRQLNRLRRRGNSTPGAGGFPWQQPYKELDPTIPVSAGTFVSISALAPLVTNTGIKDAYQKIVLTSIPGIWQALLDVPAYVTIGGTVYYDIPQVQYPWQGISAPTGASGHVIGDLDLPRVMWKLWSAWPYCS